MSVQTAYSTEHEKGFPGARGDLQISNEVTALAEEAIVFGSFVCRGTAEDTCKLPALTGDVTGPAGLGFAMRRQVDVTNMSLTPEDLRYETDTQVNIGNMITVFQEVMAGDTVVQDAPVFVRFTGGDEGRVRSDADAGDAVALPGAFFMNSGTAGELVRVRYSR